MGRKIPGRKHRGVKDPDKQAAVRFEKIKDKINAPPSDPDDQQIPYSLQRIMELKEKVKRGDFDKHRKKQKPPEKTVSQQKYRAKPEKPVPKFEQRPGESDREFKLRMDRICMKVTQEAKFEDKYGVDIIRDENGEVRVQKRRKDELELLIKRKKKEKFEKKKKKKGEVVPKLTKSQKWEKKKKEKKLKRKLNQEGHPEHIRENIKFGEVVHAPPTLAAPRKVEKSDMAARPGKKPLLLTSLLKPENNSTSLPKTANRTINRKGKRKDLPNALRRQLENQQNEIIQAYKNIKAQKHKNR